VRSSIVGSIVAILLPALLGAGQTAFAGAPTDQVRHYTDQVQKILAEPATPGTDRTAAIRNVVFQVFDINETARRALGPHWPTRTPAERQEFVQLFADLLDRTYVQKVDHYGGEQLRYTSERVDGDYAIVRAKVVTRQQAEIPVEARLHQRDGRWLIYDITLENVSLIANYRSQFDRIIRTRSYAELIMRLKAKREEFLQESATRPSPGS
jgi:phospholipid transport system substrate-binding protein